MKKIISLIILIFIGLVLHGQILEDKVYITISSNEDGEIVDELYFYPLPTDINESYELIDEICLVYNTTREAYNYTIADLNNKLAALNRDIEMLNLENDRLKKLKDIEDTASDTTNKPTNTDNLNYGIEVEYGFTGTDKHEFSLEGVIKLWRIGIIFGPNLTIDKPTGNLGLGLRMGAAFWFK